MRNQVKAERLRFPLRQERVRACPVRVTGVRGTFSPAGLSCARVSTRGKKIHRFSEGCVAEYADGPDGCGRE